MTDLNALRRELRQARRALSHAERDHKNQAITRHVCGFHRFRAARRIGAYLDFDGEVSVDAVIERCWSMGKSVYLPVLLDRNQMMFAPFEVDSTLHPNRFNILEPEYTPARIVHASNLDLVLTPLVGFDCNGNRLGVGGGYYDRHFARHRRHQKPHLIGTAYALQEAPLPPPREWDIPLRAIITESGIFTIKQHRHTVD